eukprot:scaffold12884_cov111-Isochrysis_galbana.AAC.10
MARHPFPSPASPLRMPYSPQPLREFPPQTPPEKSPAKQSPPLVSPPPPAYSPQRRLSPLLYTSRPLPREAGRAATRAGGAPGEADEARAETCAACELRAAQPRQR